MTPALAPGRRRLGLALWALAALAAVALAVGWLAAQVLSTELDRDTDGAWDGQRLYVVQPGGVASTCILTEPGGQARRLELTDQPTRGGDLADSQRGLTPGGIVVGASDSASDDAPGSLRCEFDVRVLYGAASWLPAPAEAGLWLVVPMAALVATGSALRRHPSASVR